MLIIFFVFIWQKTENKAGLSISTACSFLLLRFSIHIELYQQPNDFKYHSQPTFLLDFRSELKKLDWYLDFL